MRTLGEGSALRSAVLGETGDRLARRNRALDMRYAGIAFRHHEERKAAPLMSDLAEDLYEAFSFAFLAVGAGIDHLVADIEKLEPPKPDLVVKLTDGSSIYVEVGRIRGAASGRHSGEIDALNKGLVRVLAGDEALKLHVWKRHISFGMAVVPTKGERATVVAEIVVTLRAMRFDGLPRIAYFTPDPMVAPMLSRLSVKIAVAETSSYPYVAVSSRARIGAPAASVATFESVLRAKIANRYDAELPIWLAMPLEDDQQSPSCALAAIRGTIPADLGQFARVIVGTLDDAEVIDRR
jgi:hypothetical protein